MNPSLAPLQRGINRFSYPPQKGMTPCVLSNLKKAWIDFLTSSKRHESITFTKHVKVWLHLFYTLKEASIYFLIHQESINASLLPPSKRHDTIFSISSERHESIFLPHQKGMNLYLLPLQENIDILPQNSLCAFPAWYILTNDSVKGCFCWPAKVRQLSLSFFWSEKRSTGPFLYRIN